MFTDILLQDGIIELPKNITGVPDIPLEDLFQVEDTGVTTIDDIPLRWLSCDSTQKILGISKRSIRRYAQRGLLEKKYRTVQNNVRVYYNNRSVFKLKDRREERWIKNHPKGNPESNEIGLKELLQIGKIVEKLDQ